MNPNLQGILDFLARTDLDGTTRGPSLIWTILGGISFLLGLLLFTLLVRAFLSGHPRTFTKVVHRHHPDTVAVPARAAQEKRITAEDASRVNEATGQREYATPDGQWLTHDELVRNTAEVRGTNGQAAAA
jgi:hypothetical protein